MQEAKPGAGNRLVRVQTVRGEPYEVRGRRLVPLARVVSLGRARGTIGTHRLGGWGWGLSNVKPLAMMVETPGGGRSKKWRQPPPSNLPSWPASQAPRIDARQVQ